MSFTLIVANLHDDPRAVAQVIAHADYVMGNECRTKAARALHALRAPWKSWRPGGAGNQNPHFWDSRVIEAVSRTQAPINKGGHIGLAEARVSPALKRRFRRKRVGPGRAITAQWVHTVEARRQALMVCDHLPARWRTSEKWRLWIIRTVVEPRIRRFLANLEKYHPGVPIIYGGDQNTPNLGDVDLGPGWRTIRTLPDMGHRRYTQVKTKGPVSISHVGELHTASDHDAVVCRVSLSGPTL